MGSKPGRVRFEAGTHCRKTFSSYQALDADGGVLLPVICTCSKQRMIFVPMKDVFEGRTLPCPTSTSQST